MPAIDALEAIQAGSTTQWIRVRGADASNPVLLLIQQGPGLRAAWVLRAEKRVVPLTPIRQVIPLRMGDGVPAA